MRLVVFWREVMATTWANKVPSILVGFLVTAMVAATLLTVGRTAAAEEQLAQRLDSAGARVFTVRDASGEALLSRAIVDASGALSFSERAVGVVAPTDVVNGQVGQGGDRVATWGIVGDFDDVVRLTAGRMPEPGEALVSAAAMDVLGLDDPYGWVLDARFDGVAAFNVVGAFAAKEPFEDYGQGVLYNAGDAVSSALFVVINDPAQAVAAQQTVLALIQPPDLSKINITSPVGAAQLRKEVLGDFGNFGRTLMLGVLAGGAFLTAIVVLADVLVRRMDLGRRRALGATRGAIVGIVTARTFVPALLGAGFGVGLGVVLGNNYAAVPPTDFIAGVAILAVLVATISAIPPALFAATRDPVAVLRTP